jgi:lipocalin
MKIKCRSMGTALAALSLCACAGGPEQLVTVPFVDLSRYAGQWHEIARYPTGVEILCRFEPSPDVVANKRLTEEARHTKQV